MAETSSGTATTASGENHLHRAIGLRGLTLISLGTMIGSGWLLGPCGGTAEGAALRLFSNREPGT